MSEHNCEALVIACIDFRLIDNTNKWLTDLGLEKKYDFLGVGGASKQLASPDKPEYKELLLENIKISVNLHNISKIYIIHHEDCGAYGGKKAFENSEKEREFQINEMKKSQEIIKYLYPELEIIKIYEKLDGSMEVAM
ncbi:MAG: carbonic anhydrase [Patescibacteria group bacterium]